jgi:hypothetical protein
MPRKAEEKLSYEYKLGNKMVNSISNVNLISLPNPYTENQNKNQVVYHSETKSRLQEYISPLLNQNLCFYNKFKTFCEFLYTSPENISKLYKKIITGDPLAFYKAGKRVQRLSIKEREEIIKLNFYKLREFEIFQLWEKFNPLPEQDKIKCLATMLNTGSCLGETVCLYGLMYNFLDFVQA